MKQSRLYVQQLINLVRSSELDAAVVLAMDHVSNSDGVIVPEKTAFYVSNDYCRDICRQSSQTLLYGASVNPHRIDALDELERVVADGAVLNKLLPNSQNIDLSNPVHKPYFKKMAQLDLPLLVHCGHEHTISVVDQSLGDPKRLRPALDEGVTVIVAHAGVSGIVHSSRTMHQFLQLLERYPNCWGDTSAMANFWRGKRLVQLLDDEFIRKKFQVDLDSVSSRLINGSDYPFFPQPAAFFRRLDHDSRKQIRQTDNPLQKGIEIKRAIGMPDECLSRVLKIHNNFFSA